MKTLFIIRHAKSDQSFFGNDFERPINDRGKADAPVMAERLLKRAGLVNALISSPATRAKQTAQHFARAFQVPETDIFFISALYHAPSEVFYDVIAALPQNLDTVAIFAHNPGITHFVNSLDTGTRVDNMPTCAIFGIEADILNWADFAKTKRRFLFFDYPKNYF